MKFQSQRLDSLPQGNRERSTASAPRRSDTVPPVPENPWSRSLWLEGVVRDLTPRERLSGDHTCDVAIVGAGFGGLWTAYYLKAADPSLRVTVIEAEIAGFGAAGRNGGFVSAGIAGSGSRYARVSGWDSVLRAERETHHGVDEVGRVISAEHIDCGYNKEGALTLATTEPQAQRVRARVESKHGFGLRPEDIRFLPAEECADFVPGAAGVLAGCFTPHCARVDPARLARGLADACERLGVKIYEQSPAERVSPKVVQCRGGRVSAEVVIRATESYTIRERGQRRSFLPLYSLMIATEPLSQETWDELGWRDGLGIADMRHLYYYAQRTIDGRIALGGRGAPYRLTNPISPSNERDAGVFQRLCDTLRQAFPAASQARITHHWGGSLAVPRDWCMRTTFDRRTGLGFVGAFGGHGVVAANISGRTMRDLVLGHSTDLTSLPWVGYHTRNWEPEPIRFVASRLIAKTLDASDEYEDRTAKPAKRARLVQPFLPPS
jgi:glycine/D-amino acid oxidase-like deaminating enzyme